MNNHTILLLIILTIAPWTLRAEGKKNTDANIIGHVVSESEHLPFVNLIIEGTAIGTTTDETGHYRFINLPVGQLTIKVQALGYKSKSFEVETKAGETIELKIDLEPDAIGLEEVTITGDRNEKNRKESTVVVNTLTPKLFSTTQSVTLSEGLNFVSGLRMENNCQNCGFSQVRINGMDGPYSQILINNRPIFSGLAGVYGLEMIPANMIERVEVVRGGGSALYGSNAIAGTINLILKDPINNTYEVGVSSGMVGTGIDGSGDAASDFSLNANTSLVSPDNKTGMALYGFYRNRDPFDANDDGFSEITRLKNITFGGRAFHRLGTRSKIMADFFTISEDRRGGSNFDSPEHEADIAESVEHRIVSGALTFEQYLREKDMLTLFVSGQLVDRNSYYGAEQSLKDYGYTESDSYNAGAQYTAQFSSSNLVAGIETTGEKLQDNKLGYPDFENAVIEDGQIVSIPHVDDVLIADQTSSTTGVYAQYEYRLLRWQFSAGARFEHYLVEDLAESGSEKTGDVINPRATVKYDATKNLQFRVSYAQGYRAPQIFDEDLHIETSGSRQVIHRNDPDLKQETSHSFMASADYTIEGASSTFNILAEGFYTILQDPFVNEFGDPDQDGVVVYTRTNAEKGATVQGVNFELNYAYGRNFTAYAGLTIQESQYEETQEFDEKSFFRAPDSYGFITLNWDASKKFGVSATTSYTGKMLVPYFGNTLEDPDTGELRESDSFVEVGLKARYNIKLNGATMQLFAGIKNIFNAYQDDFDSGIDRDPGYIYGPLEPRTVYAGVKIGNFLR